jgi:hypothetical protein
MRKPTTIHWTALCAAAGLLGVHSAQALSIKSVGSVVRGTQTQVTVVFDETVDVATATSVANYTLSGRTISSAALMTGLPAADAIGNLDWPTPSGRTVDNQCVVLTVNSVLTGPQSLTVAGVKDTSGTDTLASTTRAFVASGYSWVTVGNSANDPTRVIAVGTNGFDIYSNGSANWEANDQISYVYQAIPATQPFDIKVRVEFQDTSSRWGRAGVMLRDGLNADIATTAADGANPAARTVFARVNPARKFDENSGAIGVGQNQYEFIYRSELGGTYTGPGDGTPPAYPNAWLRLVGDGAGTLTGYWSNEANPANDNFNPEAGFDLSLPYANMLGDSPSVLYLGPAYCPEIGNIPAAAENVAPGVRSRRFLAQFRFVPVASPVVTGFSSFAAGFTASILDGADTTVENGSVTATINGETATLTQNRNGNRVDISAIRSSVFTVGSSNTVVLNYRDSTGAALSRTYNFVQAPYVTLPPAWRVQAPTGQGIHGMTATFANATHGNSLANVEGIFAGTFPADFPADLFTNIVLTANWGKAGSGDIQGQFHRNATGSYKVDKDIYPDVYGWTPDQVAVRLVTYLELQPGVYRAGVASDDGYRLSVAAAASDPSGITLSQFDGGRGTPASPDLADFVVTEAGIYPFRLTWWNADGGSALEWSIIDVANNRHYLVNQQRVDADGFALTPGTHNLQAGAIRAFNTTPTVRTLTPSLSSIPANGSFEVDVRPEVAVSVNGNGAAVTINSLSLNGSPVTPTIESANGITTARFTPGAPLPFNTRQSGSVIYTASGYPTPFTNQFSFTTRSVKAAELATAGAFVIEAEDFDFGGGQSIPAASVMPYEGGAFAEHGARLNIDFQRGDGPFNAANGSRDGFNYRTGAIQGGEIINNPADGGVYVPMGGNTGGNASNGDLRNERPGQNPGETYSVATSFSIGWAAGWYNYTRNIPQGNYNVYAALSFDGRGDGQLNGRMDRITAGRGTTSQTVEPLGTFSRFGSGGWGVYALVPMVDGSGNLANVTLGGASPTTIRYTSTSGDFDWYALVPAVAPPIEPRVTGIQLNGNTIVINFVGGVLQSSTSLTGSYADVPGVTGESANIPVPAAANAEQFYRVIRR